MLWVFPLQLFPSFSLSCDYQQCIQSGTLEYKDMFIDTSQPSTSNTFCDPEKVVGPVTTPYDGVW